MGHAPWKPFAALLLVQFSFASLAVAGKIVLEDLPALTLAGIRILLASVFLSLIALATQRERVPAQDLLRFFGLSLLGVILNQLLFLEGLARTTAVNASILIATIPVFTTGLAILLRKESAQPVRLFGIGIALVGALILVGIEGFNLADDHAVGNLLIVLNCVCYSSYLILSRPFLQRYRSTTVVAWTFLFGALVTAPLAALQAGDFDFSGIPSKVWWGVVWIVLVPSVVAYSLNNYALKRIRSSTVATYIFLQPLIGIALALAFLADEHLTLRSGFGGALILVGVVVVSRAERFEPVVAIPESGEAMSRERIVAPDAGAESQPQEDDPGRRRPEAP